MKSYTITVNGKAYDVTVEEKGGATSAPVQAAPAAAAPAPAPVSSGTKGAVEIKAPMPGKVMSIKVNVGDPVKKGDTMIVFEAMKMENSVVASQDGIVASVDVEVGSSFESGETLASLN